MRKVFKGGNCMRKYCKSVFFMSKIDNIILVYSFGKIRFFFCFRLPFNLGGIRTLSPSKTKAYARITGPCQFKKSLTWAGSKYCQSGVSNQETWQNLQYCVSLHFRYLRIFLLIIYFNIISCLFYYTLLLDYDLIS